MSYFIFPPPRDAIFKNCVIPSKVLLLVIKDVSNPARVWELANTQHKRLEKVIIINSKVHYEQIYMAVRCSLDTLQTLYIKDVDLIYNESYESGLNYLFCKLLNPIKLIKKFKHLFISIKGQHALPFVNQELESVMKEFNQIA